MSRAPVCIYACVYMYTFTFKHLIHTVKVPCRRLTNLECHPSLQNALYILSALSLVAIFFSDNSEYWKVLSLFIFLFKLCQWHCYCLVSYLDSVGCVSCVQSQSLLLFSLRISFPPGQSDMGLCVHSQSKADIRA